MTFTVFQCTSCKNLFFPARYLCPVCRHADWQEVAAPYGQIEDSTAIRHRPGADLQTTSFLATIQTNAGPRVIAKLNEYLERGEKVELQFADNGALLAVRA